jgi:hypothetical protein
VNGRILSDRDGLVVELNHSLSVEDGRFVLAHELAHLIVDRRVRQTDPRHPNRDRSPWAYGRGEQLCDLAAEEILLPADWLRRELGEGKVQLEKAVAVATELTLRPTLVVRRAIRLGMWNARMVVWRLMRNRLLPIETWPSKGPGDLTDLEPSDWSRWFSLDWLAGGVVATAPITIRYSGEVVTYKAQGVMLENQRALGVLIFRE